jgi:calcineurin-like phosphoesterase family protein
MKTWITSDFHLGDDRMEILGRPFGNKEHMLKVLVDNHNMFVAPDDKLIVVGDVCRNTVAKEFISFVEKFNGKKTLIRGNHDSSLSDEELAPYFETIIPDGEGLEIEIEGIPCYATHYPTTGRKDCFNLVGHIHAAWKYQLNMFNIGIDVNNFLPVNLDTIPFHLKAITEFYDDDVWAAYNEINTIFRDRRGKKGSYFKHDKKT